MGDLHRGRKPPFRKLSLKQEGGKCLSVTGTPRQWGNHVNRNHSRVIYREECSFYSQLWRPGKSVQTQEHLIWGFYRVAEGISWGAVSSSLKTAHPGEGPHHSESLQILEDCGCSQKIRGYGVLSLRLCKQLLVELHARCRELQWQLCWVRAGGMGAGLGNVFHWCYCRSLSCK